MNKKTMLFFLTLFFSFSLICSPLSVQASTPTYTFNREYLSDGSYYEISMSVSKARSTVSNASKTVTYKNSEGKSLWYLTVVADFYFNGNTSRCTTSSVKAGTYTNTYKIESKSSGRSGNSGWAKATVGSYISGHFVASTTRTIYIYCDKNGNIS